MCCFIIVAPCLNTLWMPDAVANALSRSLSEVKNHMLKGSTSWLQSGSEEDEEDVQMQDIFVYLGILIQLQSGKYLSNLFAISSHYR